MALSTIAKDTFGSNRSAIAFTSPSIEIQTSTVSSPSFSQPAHSSTILQPNTHLDPARSDNHVGIKMSTAYHQGPTSSAAHLTTLSPFSTHTDSDDEGNLSRRSKQQDQNIGNYGLKLFLLLIVCFLLFTLNLFLFFLFH